LGEIRLDGILNDRRLSIILHLDARFCVLANGYILFDTTEVVLTCDDDAELLIFRDRAVLDYRVASETFLRLRHKPAFLVLVKLAHHYRRLCGYHLNADFGERDLAAFYFSGVAFANMNPRPLDC